MEALSWELPQAGAFSYLSQQGGEGEGLGKGSL